MKLFALAPLALLLTALSFGDVHAAPSGKELTFVVCPSLDGKSPPPPLLDVKISPNPPTPGAKETYTYSGPLKNDVGPTDTAGAALIDPTTKVPVRTVLQPVCKGKECPIKAGTSFTKTIDDLYLDEKEIPSPFTLVIAVGNLESKQVYACAMAIGA